MTWQCHRVYTTVLCSSLWWQCDVLNMLQMAFLLSRMCRVPVRKRKRMLVLLASTLPPRPTSFLSLALGQFVLLHLPLPPCHQQQHDGDASLRQIAGSNSVNTCPMRNLFCTQGGGKSQHSSSTKRIDAQMKRKETLTSVRISLLL